MKLGWIAKCVGSVMGASVLLTPSNTLADMITIGSARDATIFKGFVNNSNGGGPGIFAGADNSGNVLRGLMQFNIAAAVPAGSTITDVQLKLTLGLVAGSGQSPDTTPRTISLYRMSDDWGEGSNGNTFSVIGGTGNGFAAQTGDSTWSARMFDSASPVLWTTPGGDAAGTSSASLIVGQTLGPYTWTSTAGLVSDVQAWLDSPSANFGWLIENASEGTSKTSRAFWTREASDSTLRPQLQITYTTTPEPAGPVLILSVLSVLLCRSRDRKM